VAPLDPKEVPAMILISTSVALAGTRPGGLRGIAR